MGTMHDLSHKLGPEMTVTPGLPPPKFEQVWRIPEQMANVTYYSFSSHIGTHMDAPLHFADGRWSADLAPVCGPSLGPFALRSEALAAEREWLETHWLLTPARP